jgi:hypothetical protein
VELSIEITSSEVVSRLKNSYKLKDIRQKYSGSTETEKWLETAIGIMTVPSLAKRLKTTS